MNFINTLKLAWRSVNRSKLRSFLTALGIIIGVGAVIAMLGVGQGARDAVQSQIASLGTNLLIIYPGAAALGGVRMEAGTAQQLTEDDSDAIRKQASSIEYISPVVRTTEQVVAEKQNWRTSIYGGYPEYLTIRDWQVQSGAAFTESDQRGATKVCVIGQTVSRNLFGEGVDPVGQTIRIRNLPFRVTGLLQAKGQTGVGQDQDDIIIAPLSTVQKKLLGTFRAPSLYASAVSEKVIDQAGDEITQILRDRHKLGPFDDNDFTVRTQTEIANTAGATFGILSVLLASIASISLIVGGIGIMNIMLVSVTERTREIGIRMAVGARSRDVLFQFLIEAIFLSFSGGIVGVAIGIVVLEFVSGVQNWAITIQPQAIALAFLFATAVGVFFGWYPAKKASNLNPIEALRYE